MPVIANSILPIYNPSASFAGLNRSLNLFVSYVIKS
jgi:hypothetical protein